MGGGPDKTTTEGDFEQIQAKATERLRRIAEESTLILFVCEAADRGNLDAALTAYNLSHDRRVRIAVPNDVPSLSNDVRLATLIVAFTMNAKSTEFIDSAIRQSVAQRKLGVHVRGSDSAVVPAQVSASRWRSMTWPEFLELFS
jgi:hypothetical protein